MTRKALLVCGVLSSLLYVAMTVYVAAQWEAYSSVSQTISELSAIGAPTRSLWLVPAAFYTVLVTAFGWGVWKSAGRSRLVRSVGGLIAAYGALGLIWPFAPMHLRDVLAAGGGTLSDTTHLALATVTVLIMLIAIVLGAFAFGMRFRIYSIASLVILATCGALTFLEAPDVGSNLPTPLIGVWERVNVGVFLLWVVVLAVRLWHARGTQDPDALLAYLREPRMIRMGDQRVLVVEAVGDPTLVSPAAFKLLFKTYFALKGVSRVGPHVAPRARWTFSPETPRDKWAGQYALPVPDSVSTPPIETSAMRVVITTWPYGDVAEILHQGPYSSEQTDIERLHECIVSNGYRVIGDHEEDYVKGPGMIFAGDPDTYLTIIRLRIAPAVATSRPEENADHRLLVGC